MDRRLVRASGPARVHLGVAGVLACCAAALIVAQAALLAHAVAAAVRAGASVSDLRGTLVALAVVTVGRSLVMSGFELAGRLGAARVMRDLRARLARRLLVVRPGRRAQERTGELATMAVQGVDSLERYFAGYVPQLALGAVVPVAVLVWTATLSWPAALILGVTIPILILFMVLVGLGANARTAARWRALTFLSSHFLDVVRGLPTLRAFNREAVQAERIAEVGDSYRVETMGTLRIAFLSAFVLELCAMLGTALVAATVGIALAGGHLQLEAGLTVLILAPELYAPLRGIGQQFHAAADGTAAADRILDVLDEPALVAEPVAPVPAPDPSLQPLRLEGVRFTHPGSENEVLRGVDLRLAPGTVTALVGPSGAGKTTLANLVLRLTDPSAGAVRCGAVDLRDVAADEWRHRIAWVPQRPLLLAGSIARNLRLLAPDATDTAVRAAARAVGLAELVDSLPDGFETQVGDGGRRLSAGQTHRLALGRALLSNAPLIVLDEPTAHLDRETARRVAGAVMTASMGRTALILTHDTELASRADQVVALTNGRAHIEAPQWVAA